MKNIFKIFRTDMHGLFTNFFALVVCIGICVLPALYAWFNIYANWDPYSNTGNLEIAVANEDRGYTDEKGQRWNLGEQVITDLKKQTKINWQFLCSGEEAMAGVEAGDYYAAIVLDRDFSKNMATGLTEGAEKSIITYYTNDKKNAVAIKITDTAVNSVRESINGQYVKQLYKGLISTTNKLFNGQNLDSLVDSIPQKLEEVSASLKDSKKLIKSLQKSNGKLQTALTNSSKTMAKGIELLNRGAGNLGEGVTALDSARELLISYQANLNASIADVTSSLVNLSQDIENAGEIENSAALKQAVEKILTDAETITDKLTTLANALGELESGDESVDAQALESAENLIYARDAILEAVAESGLEEYITGDFSVKEIHSRLDVISGSVSTVRVSIAAKVLPEVSNMMLRLENMVKNAQALLKDLSNVLGVVNNTMDSANKTIGVATTSLDSLLSLLDGCSERLDQWVQDYRSSNIRQKLTKVTGFLGGNPNTLGEYFSAPVKVEEHKVYAISSYGSGMSPFYSTLAIWVGMTILASVMKPHARREMLDHPKEHELFFGRYLLFFLLSQLQTAVIVLGDFCIFHIQCLHPFQFWLAAAMASLTFSLIVFSLAISFGDIGKALAIIILVIQIAGSGGTYPIEALPAFYQNIYKFFPFPYVIDAMRECIGGMYGNTYIRCMGVLGLFCAFALLIGLLVRLPIIGLNSFVEKRLEDTRFM